MGCHVCVDEVYAVLAMLALWRPLSGWVRSKWATRHQHPNCRHDGHGEGR